MQKDDALHDVDWDYKDDALQQVILHDGLSRMNKSDFFDDQSRN